MKKSVFTVLLAGLALLTYGQTTSYSTSGTNTAYVGQWTKIAALSLVQQYTYAASVIQLIGLSSTNYKGSCNVFFSVKQQAPFPGSPYIQLELLERNNQRISKNDFIAVITDQSGSGYSGNTIVELYVRITNSHERLLFTPVLASPPMEFFSSQSFFTTLPAGTQIDCSYKDAYAKNGFFEENVGIGTTTPDAKLTVKGTIHTQEVKVDLAGAVAPDFVFEENYPLPALAETAAYITANKHLPGIPSAAEMEENGLNLKEMNLKLLQKVEELTLYVIELQKENIRQSESLQIQEDQITDLRAKIN